ncbi:MAG: hypothetical protein IKC03_03120 [Oscillospiraceae bacterium]|nr:hypothetical protein [Oscillospiraceae bacterium]
MILLISIKIFCDLCLYAGAATVVALWFSSIGTLFPQILCCTAGIALAAALENRSSLRYLGVPVAISSLALCTCTAEFIAVFFMVAYCIFVIHRELFALEYDSYTDFFSLSIQILLVTVCFASINMDWLAMLPYACAYLFGAVFLLRQLRLGSGSWRDRLLNALTLIAILGLGVAVCAAAYFVLLLRYPVGDLLQWFLSKMLFLLEGFVYIVTYVVYWIATLLRRRRGEEIQVNGSAEGTPEPTEPIPPDAPAGEILGALFLLLTMIAAVLIGRKLLHLLRKNSLSGNRTSYTESIRPIGERRREKITGNRAKIRAFYRKFLRLVQDRGGEIRPHHTSEDILLTAALMLDAKSSLALRELYLSARYDESNEITDQQVREAKNLYHTLRDK